MGGKRSRDKGNRSERDLVHRAKAAGIKAWRVPLSGAQQGYPDDVILERADGEQLRVECKVRADGFKQMMLGTWLIESAPPSRRRRVVMCDPGVDEAEPL